MERINKYNYEWFFVDYLDGNLTTLQKEDLMSFLKMHPDLEQELEEMKNFRLEEEQIAFQPKQSLKKQLTLPEDEDYTVFDELCIARLEGSFKPNKLKELNKYMEVAPHRIKTFKLYQKTLLKPDRKIKYPEKSSLKKGKMIQIYRKTVYSYVWLAASVLLLIGLFFSLPGEQNIPYINELSGEAKSIDKKVFVEEKKLAGTRESTEFIKSAKDLQIDCNKLYPQQNIQLNIPGKVVKQAIVMTEIPEPITPEYGIEISGEPLYADIIEIKERRENLPAGDLQFNSYDVVNRFLTQRFEKSVKNNLANRKFSLWEIAELGFDGISKLTGKEIFVERHYDGQGNLQKLALHTESFRFSTDLNK